MRARGGLVCLLLLTGAVPAQPPPDYIPGRPWTAVVPDPDRYDWNQTNRPGYRFRGMEPMHQRFYDYIQAKRREGTPLSSVERMLIRSLTAARRWPEAPRPNEFWAAYMRWLREQTTDELNTAQNLMLTELMQRGFVVMDMPPNANVKRALDYLESGPFECRNWFERYFTGRMEPWLDYALASHGYPLSAPAPGGNVFPPTGEFNGMSITYNPSGCSLVGAEDTGGFTTSRSVTGTFTPPCTLSVSGQVTSGGFGADMAVTVWGGTERGEQKQWVPRPKDALGRASYNVSIKVPANATEAGFSIRLDGSYSMGGGHRGLVVHCKLVPDAATQESRRKAADEAWRRQVEETLAKLGYSDTPEGKELATMRDALKGTDDDWRRYVDEQQKKLGYDSDPAAEELRRLRQAAEQGGPGWDDYVRRHVDDQGGTIDVGAELADGQLAGVANTFVKPAKLSCKLDHQDLPEGTKVIAVWYRDDKEFIRSEREASGTGWVSFSVMGGGGQPLAPGKYKLVVTAGGQELGWRNFTVK